MPKFDRPTLERPPLSRQLLGSALIRPFIAGFVCAVLVLAVSGGCANSGLSFGGRPLRVGISPDYPPVIFEVDGEVVGIEADFARLVGNSLGRKIVFSRYAFPELLDALERKEVDVVMSGLSVSPERAERVSFTTPYMDVGQLALIRSRDIARFGRIQGTRRAGARVGYQVGTSGEAYVANSLPRSASFGFKNVEDGLRSLRANRIDYFIHDAPTVWRVAGDIRQRDLHGLYRPLTEEQLAWAVHPENTQLRSLLDATLAHWKREGIIDPIVQRWIPVRVTLR